MKKVRFSWGKAPVRAAETIKHKRERWCDLFPEFVARGEARPDTHREVICSNADVS